MIINKGSRILTVGDGDLSFSRALAQNKAPSHLQPTVYDKESTVRDKYRNNAIDDLLKAGITPLFEFDVREQDSWQSLATAKFDLVIFQFPLMPAVGSSKSYHQGPSLNIRNRLLLRQFIKNAARYALEPNGAQLIYITSKDVKPYRDWNIEDLANGLADISYLGRCKFQQAAFPDYMVRNVDRDKAVKDTQAYTYVWSLNSEHAMKARLENYVQKGDRACDICRAGPFASNDEKIAHEQSARHIRMMKFNQEWLAYIQLESNLK